MKEIKYEIKGRRLITPCPYGEMVLSIDMVRMVSGGFCAGFEDTKEPPCPHYHGPGSEPNTILCDYEEEKS